MHSIFSIFESARRSRRIEFGRGRERLRALLIRHESYAPSRAFRARYPKQMLGPGWRRVLCMHSIFSIDESARRSRRIEFGRDGESRGQLECRRACTAGLPTACVSRNGANALRSTQSGARHGCAPDIVAVEVWMLAESLEPHLGDERAL